MSEPSESERLPAPSSSSGADAPGQDEMPPPMWEGDLSELELDGGDRCPVCGLWMGEPHRFVRSH